MPISHKHRCIFIHVPKCGGTSIEDALGMLRDWRLEDAAAMYGRVASPAWLALNWGSNFLQHLTWDEFTQAVPMDRRLGYRSFAFVRHPLHRIASEWSHIDGDLLDYARTRGVELAGLNFEDFVTQAVGRSQSDVATPKSGQSPASSRYVHGTCSCRSGRALPIRLPIFWIPTLMCTSLPCSHPVSARPQRILVQNGIYS